MNYIFIDSNDGINKVGIVEDNELVEYYAEEEARDKLVGNVYRARVENVLKGMNASFVDIGEGKNAYLYVRDALSREQYLSKKKYSIEQTVTAGEDIIVQVTKEAVGDKGPKISKHISIPGRYLVLTPFSQAVNVSRRIRARKELERLRTIGRNMVSHGYGIIFRTISQGVDEELLVEEYRLLSNIYEKIESQRNFLPTPKLLYKELDLPYRIVRDNFNEKEYRIIVNNREVYDHLLQLEEYYLHGLSDRMQLDVKFSSKYNGNIQKGIQEAFKRKVHLKSGGHIVIDETEALTAIDVNTGRYVGSYSLEETIVNTNIEASREIARQIRLRDIGGIIIIDFIDMRNKDNIPILMSSLAEQFKNDKNKPNIIDMTKLGLVEVTRKRIGPTLDHRISTQCPHCNGRGRIQK